MNNLQIIFLVLCAVLFEELVRLNTGVKRASNFFIIRRRTITQRLNRSGVEALRKYRKKQQGKTLDSKLIAFGGLLLRDLPNVFKAMEVGKSYRIHTHLVKYLKHMALKSKLEIIDERQTRRRLLIEAISFLGIKDFVHVLFSKKEQKKLWKQFYKLTIRRM